MSRLFMQDTRLAAFEREMMATPGFGLRRTSDVEMPMPKPFRGGYSWWQVADMGFPSNDYEFPNKEGAFTGTLVMKKWNRQNGLMCYFDTNDGYKYKLCVWPDYDEKRAYRPIRSDVDITLIDIGAVIKVVHGLSKTKKSKWLDVEVLEMPA